MTKLPKWKQSLLTDLLFDTQSVGENAVQPAHRICKDACVLSRNNDLIKSKNCLDLTDSTSNHITEVMNKPETAARKREISRNLVPTTEDNVAVPTLKWQCVTSLMVKTGRKLPCPALNNLLSLTEVSEI